MKPFSRIICMVLVLCIAAAAIPMPASAYYAEKNDHLQITDKNGNTVTVDESWEQAFPYGTFAFAANQVTVQEGGESRTITVYRLGGTKGRAEAYITYIPAIAEMEDGVHSYANAAGGQDLTIEIEDPLPIVQYQPLGADPQPLAHEPDIAVYIDESHSSENTFDEDGVTVKTYGDICLRADIEADAYQWHVLSGSEWEAIDGGTQQTLIVSREHWDDYDFRCVFTLDTGVFCTSSAKGVAYESPEAEVLPEIPEEGVELNPEPTRSTLPMDGDPFSGHVFSMVFADGEWVKEIRVTALEDDEHEADEFGTFTIAGNEGASLYDTANTLALHVVDNDEALPSSIFFDAGEITVDRSEGNAVLKVRRTGATQYVLSVDYVTMDGTASAGEDYAAASGTLVFYAGIDEMTITIPLVTDSPMTGEKSFTVGLSNLRGGGAGAEITGASASVRLTGGTPAGRRNIATLLHEAAGSDVSSQVALSDTPTVGAAGTITAEEAETGEPGIYADVGVGLLPEV